MLSLSFSLCLSLAVWSFPQIMIRRSPGHVRPLKHTPSSSSLKVSMSYGPAPSHTGSLATLHLANAAIFTLPTMWTQVKSLNCIDANEMKLRSKTSDQSDLIHLLCIHPQPSLLPLISTNPFCLLRTRGGSVPQRAYAVLCQLISCLVFILRIRSFKWFQHPSDAPSMSLNNHMQLFWSK